MGKKLLRSGSSYGPNVANIILYPNEIDPEGTNDEPACETYVADSIDYGFSQLTDDGLLGEYNVYKYTYDSNKPPAFDSSSTSIDDLQKEWPLWLDGELEDDNSDDSEYWAGEPYEMAGCHMLVAQEFKDSGGSASSDYNRAIDYNTIQDCGFNEPQAMFLGLKDHLVYEDKQENYAIQEPLHTFIPQKYIAEHHKSLLDPDDPDEHQLGSITSGGAAHPMITGHASTDDRYTSQEGKGECSTSWKWDGDHLKILTSCTKKAMYETAKNA